MTNRRIVRRRYATHYRHYFAPALGCAGYATLLWIVTVLALHLLGVWS
jgi:hypothetical protein